MDKQKLASVFNALGQMQVSGYQNITLMAGCMQVLKDMIEDTEMAAENAAEQ